MTEISVPPMLTARFYSEEAKELEELARTMPPGQSRSQLLKIADEFEAMARIAENDRRP